MLTITAPKVPPNTMKAAVICETSLILPPSINRPPTMPPNASKIPPTVAMSGRAPGFLSFPGVGFLTLDCSAMR